MVTLSNEKEAVYEEVRVLTKQEEIALLKARGREQTDPVQKLYGIYDQIAAILALIDDEAFRKRIGVNLQRLDLNASRAQNWIDNGRDPTDFYLVSCHNRLNDALMILAEVESRAIQEGVIPAVKETVEQLLESELVYQLKRNLLEEDDGKEDDGEA